MKQTFIGLLLIFCLGLPAFLSGAKKDRSAERIEDLAEKLGRRLFTYPDPTEEQVWLHETATILLERTNQGRRHRRGTDTVWWSIHDMIQPNHNGELVAKGGELYPQNPTWMANIFYGQAWAFVHFSWFYDGGKYRENLLKYQERVYKLDHGPEALAECYGRPSPDDWGEIEKEYMWYWRQCLKKPAGRKVVDGVPTGKWYIPNTDPPEGKYEPDDEGGGDYDE